MRFTDTTRAAGVKWAMSLMMLLILPGIACADVLHFYNGKLLRGKIKRVTGDIIEFKQDDMFGSTENVARLTLSNRYDMVETLTGHKYYGEIFYKDKFKIDLKAPSGLLKINCLRVKNIVMGTPMQQPSLPNTSGFLTQPLSIPGQAHAAMPVSSYANTAIIPEPSPELRGPTPEGKDMEAKPPTEEY